MSTGFVDTFLKLKNLIKFMDSVPLSIKRLNLITSLKDKDFVLVKSFESKLFIIFFLT